MTIRFHLAALACLAFAAFAAFAGDPSVGQYTAAERKHWSLRPRETPAIPTFSDPWAAQPIDAFVLQKLNDQGLRHAPPVSRRALVRRVTLDLIG